MEYKDKTKLFKYIAEQAGLKYAPNSASRWERVYYGKEFRNFVTTPDYLRMWCYEHEGKYAFYYRSQVNNKEEQTEETMRCLNHYTPQDVINLFQYDIKRIKENKIKLKLEKMEKDFE
jgi:hypothetical protein